MIADRILHAAVGLRSAKKSHYCVISILTLFIVIAASRTVNKNVSIDAVIGAKRGTEPGVHKLLTNYQTAVSVTSLDLRTAGTQSDSSG